MKNLKWVEKEYENRNTIMMVLFFAKFFGIAVTTTLGVRSTFYFVVGLIITFGSIMMCLYLHLLGNVKRNQAMIEELYKEVHQYTIGKEDYHE
jgi:hypothetical protein